MFDLAGVKLLTRYRGKTAKEAKTSEEWYWANRDSILAKQREKRSTPEYKQKQREYYQKRKKELNERQKERRIEQRAERFVEWQTAGGKKKEKSLHRIENINFNDWRTKKLYKKDEKCLVCGQTEPIDRRGNRNTLLVLHHLDYDIPELTTTLCYSCHRKVHVGKIKLSFEAKTCPICGHIVYKVFYVPPP